MQRPRRTIYDKNLTPGIDHAGLTLRDLTLWQVTDPSRLVEFDRKTLWV